MAVTVSLYELVLVKDSQRAWPAEFRSLVEACEKDLADRLPFGVVADWCDEQKEPELGEAFRWLHKRPAVEIERITETTGREVVVWYRLKNPPDSLRYVTGDSGYGLLGVVVSLAERLAEIREALS